MNDILCRRNFSINFKKEIIHYNNNLVFCDDASLFIKTGI